MIEVPNRAPRAPGFTYVGLHCYFLTICTHQRRRCFECHDAATWLLSQIRSHFEASHFAVLAYCVMPDHVHLLLEGVKQEANLRAAVHLWKRRTGFAWKQRTGFRLWQEGYYDHVLREGDCVHQIVSYIVGNPVRAGLVKHVTEYPYAGPFEAQNDCGRRV